MTLPTNSAFESLIERDRAVVTIALTLVVVLAWVYLLSGAGMGMSGLEMTRLSQVELSGANSGSSMPHAAWTPGYAALMFVMWSVMMVAMMLPSAAPMILLFATVNRKERDSGHPHVATSIFALGYLAAWAGFSLLAVILQWSLHENGILSPMLVARHAFFGGALLIAAGLYQLTPIKLACLRYCRSPLEFLGHHWQRGNGGALRMGLLHGAYCVGCCWFLMGLMFIGGLMNLYWIAGLALFVLFEKSLPASPRLGYATGVALIFWGAGTLALAF